MKKHSKDAVRPVFFRYAPESAGASPLTGELISFLYADIINGSFGGFVIRTTAPSRVVDWSCQIREIEAGKNVLVPNLTDVSAMGVALARHALARRVHRVSIRANEPITLSSGRTMWTFHIVFSVRSRARRKNEAPFHAFDHAFWPEAPRPSRGGTGPAASGDRR